MLSRFAVLMAKLPPSLPLPRLSQPSCLLHATTRCAYQRTPHLSISRPVYISLPCLSPVASPLFRSSFSSIEPRQKAEAYLRPSSCRYLNPERPVEDCKSVPFEAINRCRSPPAFYQNHLCIPSARDLFSPVLFLLSLVSFFRLWTAPSHPVTFPAQTGALLPARRWCRWSLYFSAPHSSLSFPSSSMSSGSPRPWAHGGGGSPSRRAPWDGLTSARPCSYSLRTPSPSSPRNWSREYLISISQLSNWTCGVAADLIALSLVSLIMPAPVCRQVRPGVQDPHSRMPVRDDIEPRGSQLCPVHARQPLQAHLPRQQGAAPGPSGRLLPAGPLPRPPPPPRYPRLLTRGHPPQGARHGGHRPRSPQHLERSPHQHLPGDEIRRFFRS